jgi:type IV pilus assembly protein PilN
MQFTINLATKSYINQKQLYMALTACSIVLLFFLFVNIKIFAFNAAEISRLTKNEADSAAKHGASGRAVTEEEYSRLLASIKQANGIIEKKTFNWLSLLDRLESVVPEGVSLSAVEPGVKDKSLKLSGTALHFKNLRQFMENLEASVFFPNVFLLDQGEDKTSGPQKGTTFNITCRYAL